ncbi:MAG: hypothetical protein QOE98_650 [Gaiellaceae bacterium]|nr:hypothetical protein [Gaiellaceae bacterium]
MLESCRNVLASRGGYILIMALWIPSALYADATFDRWAQDVVSLVTWALLAAVFVAVDGHERRQLIVVVVVATMFEITFSIIWGLYVYRFDNLPLYVPPGHGLIYLLALRLSQFTRMHASRRLTSGLVTVAVSAWVAGALVLPDHPDLVGLLLLPSLLYCLWRARRWHVYAGAFVATTILEIAGTQFGNWRWADSVPGIGLSQGNPPSAIAAGYCLLDAIVLFLAGRVWVARIPLGRRVRAPEPVTDAAG